MWMILYVNEKHGVKYLLVHWSIIFCFLQGRTTAPWTVNITFTATLATVCWCAQTGSPEQRARQSERGRSATAPTSRCLPPTSRGPVPTCPGPPPTSQAPAPICLAPVPGFLAPVPTWQLSLPWRRGKELEVPVGGRTGSPGTADWEIF